MDAQSQRYADALNQATLRVSLAEAALKDTNAALRASEGLVEGKDDMIATERKRKRRAGAIGAGVGLVVGLLAALLAGA